MKVNILGVKIDNLKKLEVLEVVKKFLTDGRQHYIVTPNPEMAVAVEKDNDFLEILNKADLAIPDGFGLILASHYLRRPLSEKIHGVDLMLDLCRLAEQKNYSIYLFGGEEGIAKKAAENLVKIFPKLKVAGAESGGIINDYELTIKNNQKISFTSPDILFVALGAGKQEKWIVKNLQKFPSIKIAMGVGGAFDFIAGKIKRAPGWMRKIGLEWLWRLFLQPWRLKRVFTATIKFSWKVIKNGRKYA